LPLELAANALGPRLRLRRLNRVDGPNNALDRFAPGPLGRGESSEFSDWLKVGVHAAQILAVSDRSLYPSTKLTSWRHI